MFTPKSDAAVAVTKVADLGHPELVGETLRAEALSETEARELRALSDRRRSHDFAEIEMRRYEQLVGKAAGDEGYSSGSAWKRTCGRRSQRFARTTSAFPVQARSWAPSSQIVASSTFSAHDHVRACDDETGSAGSYPRRRVSS